MNNSGERNLSLADGGFLYPSLSGSFENTRHVWVLFGLLAAVRELGSES